MSTPLSRRHLLAGAATLALGPRAFAQATPGAQGEGRLVVVFLRGAVDGLSLFVPYADPDYARLRLAIQRWTAAVPKQPPASTHSRSVFFFSGHGVGANRTPLLLPADYLDPQFGDPQLENCFSAREFVSPAWRIPRRS